MNTKKVCLALFVYLNICTLTAETGTYLASIENRTRATIYQAILEENYKLIINPGDTKKLGHWVRLKNAPIMLAAIKGVGEPVYISEGPESSGNCTEIPYAILTWTGQQLPPSYDITHTTFCFTGNDVELGLVIDEYNEPHVNAINNATKLSEF